MDCQALFGWQLVVAQWQEPWVSWSLHPSYVTMSVFILKSFKNRLNSLSKSLHCCLCIILCKKFILFKKKKENTSGNFYLPCSSFILEVGRDADDPTWLNVWAVKNNPDTSGKWSTGSLWHTVAKQLWN